MEFQYELDSEDILVNQLYYASIAPHIRKKKNRTWLIAAAMYLVLAVAFYFLQGPVIAYIFLGLGIVWFAGYPLYYRWRVRSQFKKQIDQMYKPGVKKRTTMNLGEKEITIQEGENEGSIKLADIEKIVEIDRYYFIILGAGATVMIPKETDNDNDPKEFIDKVCAASDVGITPSPGWKWR